MRSALTFDVDEHLEVHDFETGPGTAPLAGISVLTALFKKTEQEGDITKSQRSSVRRKASAVASAFFSLVVGSTCLGLASGIVIAEDSASPVKQFEDFDAKNFSRPAQIDNEWMPLKPGTRFTYAGTTIEDDGTPVPHRVVITVTDLTKVIAGIRTVVSWDLDYSAGELVEAELAFFAQDNDGNVWRMGEHPEEYEDGRFVAAPTWIHGIQDARAGISMKAEPRLGTPSYSQGWGPAVKWTDRGQVDQMGQKTCVPVKCYEEVLVIAETSQAEPDAQQLKYWARGVGNVRVGWRGKGEKSKETLELVELVQLGPAALAEARAEALKLERSGYKVSKNVYAQTAPAEPMNSGARE